MMKKQEDETTSSWTRWKHDPRIVRVSKALGGKDRHSKVSTVRGLRDRRVRLSVNTAIQLYDLQERLGLNQPSKVVDWLLNVAKNEIDELPPLQIPPGSFARVITKNALSERSEGEEEEEDERQLVINVENPNFVTGNNFMPSRENQYQKLSSVSDFLNTSSSSSVPYNLTLSQAPRSHGLNEDLQNFVSQSHPSGFHHHQFLVYQPGISTHSYFPPQMAATNFQISSSSPMVEPVIRPIHFNLLPDSEGQRPKDSI